MTTVWRRHNRRYTLKNSVDGTKNIYKNIVPLRSFAVTEALSGWQVDGRERFGWEGCGWGGGWLSSGITSTIAEPEGATKSPLCEPGETLSATPPAWLPQWQQWAERRHCHVPQAHPSKKKRSHPSIHPTKPTLTLTSLFFSCVISQRSKHVEGPVK